MNKILIPTDLTELGDFAYRVAAKISAQTNAQIHLLSIVPGPQGAIYDAEGFLVENDGNDYSEFNQKKESLEERLAQYANDKNEVNNTQVSIGRVDHDIIYYAENNAIDLIVMGTEGAHGMKEWIRGSHAEYLTNHSKVPVLSLKCDRSDLNLDNIVFVSDFREKKKLNLQIIKEIQASFGSTLVLLKIKTPKHQEEDQKVLQTMKNFVTRNELEKVAYHIYQAPLVEQGINEFCAAQNIDLVAMGTHQRRGISKLFRENIADDVVNHVYHPILTFPL